MIRSSLRGTNICDEVPHFDQINAALGGVDDLAAQLHQQAADARAATRRCIKILTAANSDDECQEGLRLVVGIGPVMYTRPL